VVDQVWTFLGWTWLVNLLVFRPKCSVSSVCQLNFRISIQ
jgi:hypothetical protein